MSVQGKWELTVTRPDGTVTASLDLSVQGGVVTGTSTRSDGMSTEILDGLYDGETLSFFVDIQQPVAARLRFSLAVSGDTLSGTFSSPQVGEGKVAGKRVL